ncbi:MAG: hypothetical protein ABJG33_08970 [Balneola sp.]
MDVKICRCGAPAGISGVCTLCNMNTGIGVNNSGSNSYDYLGVNSLNKSSSIFENNNYLEDLIKPRVELDSFKYEPFVNTFNQDKYSLDPFNPLAETYNSLNDLPQMDGLYGGSNVYKNENPLNLGPGPYPGWKKF